MNSLFFTLNTARLSLLAQQAGLNITSHNIANANTPGYSRQKVVMETTMPLPVPSVNMPAGAGQVGTGVQVSVIERVRDTYLDGQIRNELQKLGGWEQRRDALERVEIAFMEPGENGLAALLGEFWDGWQELSYNPESSPVRAATLEKAVSLAETLRDIHTQLQTVAGDLNGLVALKVEQVNTCLRQIAALNRQIFSVKSAGMSPNDLLDRRDLLLDELGKIVAIKTEPVLLGRGGESFDTGAIRVMLRDRDSVVLVGWDDASATPLVNELEAVEGDGGYYTVSQGGMAVSGDELGGELGGLFVSRDVLVQNYIDKLNLLARALAAKVNEIHEAGRGLDGGTGRSFFVDAGGGTVDGAGEIYVNPDLLADVSALAAAGSGEGAPPPGDGSNALAIAKLRHQSIEGGEDEGGLNGFTIDTYYTSLISRLGVSTRESQRMVENQNVLVDQITRRKEAASGVSIDEEVVNLIQYQYAYQAAAKVVSVVDEMLDTLINRMAP